VTNSGGYKGKEIVQLYIRDMVASVTRPIKELKGFSMLELEPKESKTVTFTLSDEELGFYNNNGEFLVEQGDFKVFLGGSSNTAIQESFTIQ
jgi:beta-glucosidase